MPTPLTFEITHQSADCHARVGRVHTAHGTFETPVFMPVGTQGAVKGLMPRDVAATGSQIVLANTYHLLLRPGPDLVADMGGLHTWMRWDRPILTDSGGYQVFSLCNINRVTDDGVHFRSHLDGSAVDLTPQRSIQVQNQLGADIIMALDECPPAPPPEADEQQDKSQVASPKSQVRETDQTESGERSRQAENQKSNTSKQSPSSTCDLRLTPLATRQPTRSVAQASERSIRWLDRCVRAHRRADEQALFGIVQGGTDLELRSACTQRVLQHDLPGYAIGGVSVGEGYAGLKSVVEHTAPQLPSDKPRYLMGVGYERDLLTAVRAGVDMFDCVLPTRNGRNANAFTPAGQIRLRNNRFARDQRPLDPACDCPACGDGGFSRSYLRHLFLAGEMLGPILVSLHNLRHFHRYLLDIRRAIVHNDWSTLDRAWPSSRPPDP